jgi:hypothetical protein
MPSPRLNHRRKLKRILRGNEVSGRRTGASYLKSPAYNREPYDPFAGWLMRGVRAEPNATSPPDARSETVAPLRFDHHATRGQPSIVSSADRTPQWLAAAALAR